MKKEYDFYVSRRNTPHLDLYTELLAVCYFFTGTNFAVSFCYGLYINQRELAKGCLVLSLLMYSIISLKTTDLLRENRGLVAVVAGGVIHALSTLSMIYVFSFWILIVAYIIEVICVARIIRKYFKQFKRNKKR